MVGGVQIILAVGVLVVVAMVSGPPQRPPLGSGRSEQGKHELPAATGFERFVGEVAMVEACYCKHPKSVKGCCDSYR